MKNEKPSRGKKNRTPKYGFGDHCFTIKLYLQNACLYSHTSKLTILPKHQIVAEKERIELSTTSLLN